MELRTVINIQPSDRKITYSDPVLFTGSCFAAEIGSKMQEGMMPVMINPAGTVYNPVSVINTLNTIIPGKTFTKDDLYHHKDKWLSFSHYTDFSSDDPEDVLDKINRRSAEAREFIKSAGFLFVTFGTARVFRLKSNGEIVSNCHKIPQSMFERELLTVDSVVTLWMRQLDILKKEFPGMKVIFTISPVRHWKDGPHGNQVSKSVLFLAVEELLRHPSSPEYFPAYEILMDELRDYRFYADDMLHPSGVAVDFIWEAFKSRYLGRNTTDTWKEASAIVRARRHRITSETSGDTRAFAETVLQRIANLSEKIASPELTEAKFYFEGLIRGK